MVYRFQLLPHANIRYQESLAKLGQTELLCMLRAIDRDAQVSLETIGGVPFLSFDTEVPLNEAELRALSAHSAVLLMCEQVGPLLRPLDKQPPAYLPKDAAELLKYKGKTSAVFTHMMLNCAHAASDFFHADTPLTVLDPMCGKATTCFCALERGWHAVGIDVDVPALQEADRYFTKYLQFHKLKHKRAAQSLTVKGRGVPETHFTLADTREHYADGDVRTLRLLQCDTANADLLCRKQQPELLVCDLPYGVQHAPDGSGRPTTFAQLLKHALPAWHSALKDGGAMAISFNTYTLPREQLITLVQQAGFTPMEQEPWQSFTHFVEQAVMRDVIVAKK